jgi:hypothetical protein
MVLPLAPNQYCFRGVCDWGLISGLCACKADAGEAGNLPLEPHLQSILLWLFWRQGLKNYLVRIASNHDPPNLSLLSS